MLHIIICASDDLFRISVSVSVPVPAFHVFRLPHLWQISSEIESSGRLVYGCDCVGSDTMFLNVAARFLRQPAVRSPGQG